MTTSVQHDAAAGIPVVSARGLTKRFGGQQAVNGIAFDIYPGRCFGFVGPNGAGKTTTLRLTMGLTPTSSGTLSVFGLPVTGNLRRFVPVWVSFRRPTTTTFSITTSC